MKENFMITYIELYRISYKVDG